MGLCIIKEKPVVMKAGASDMFRFSRQSRSYQ